MSLLTTVQTQAGKALAPPIYIYIYIYIYTRIQNRRHQLEMKLKANTNRKYIYTNKQKHSYRYVKEQIDKEGYKLLSKEYENNRVKLELQCNNGHKFEMKWNDFQRGNRCPICYEIYIRPISLLKGRITIQKNAKYYSKNNIPTFSTHRSRGEI